MNTFPPGGFDSLGAVEMSSSVGSAFGLQLPGTLVFDYPSVSTMATYVHQQIAPKDSSMEVMVGAGAMHLVGTIIAGGDTTERVISITSAARLPVQAGSAAFAKDAIGLVPYGRWDLESLRVSCSLICLP